MKRLIIFASAKGGVGKSYASRAFIDLSRRAGRRVSAWDLDGGTGSLALLYPDRDPEKGTGSENVRNPKSPGKWLEAMHGDSDDVLLDVPGGAFGDLVRVLDGGAPSLLAEVKATGRELVVVSVIGIKRDATFAPQDAIKMFGTDAHYVALKNGYFGEPEDFVIFDGLVDGEDPKTRKYGKSGAAVEEAGGEVVYLPKLSPITDALLDVKGLTFAQGTEALEALGRRHSSNCRLWLNSVESTFAGTWLSPSGTITPGKTARKHVVNGVD